MFPRFLSEWTVEVILSLIEKGVFEDESFDFKEKLPDSRNNEHKDRMKKTCAAFANSEGGFIVFGVSDDKLLGAKDRVVGLKKDTDFPEHFGNYPKLCYPSVRWEFKNPPIELDGDRVVQVVFIPKSWRVPHAVSTSEGVYNFPKRTNKGNESMSIDEIKGSYLGFYEKRIKLQLLYAELTSIKETTISMFIPEDQLETHYSLVSYDTSIIEMVLSDTFTLTASNTLFHSTLNTLRQSLRILNNKINSFIASEHFPMTNKASITANHNRFIRDNSSKIVDYCEICIAELEKIMV